MHFRVISDARWTIEADRHKSHANTSTDSAASQKKPLNPLGDSVIVAHQGDTGFQWLFLFSFFFFLYVHNKILSIWLLISVGNSTLCVASIFPP